MTINFFQQVVVHAMKNRDVDAGLATRAMTGVEVEHYSGARGKILEVRQDGGMRIDWGETAKLSPELSTMWYHLSPGVEGAEPSVKLATMETP